MEKIVFIISSPIQRSIVIFSRESFCVLRNRLKCSRYIPFGKKSRLNSVSLKLISCEKSTRNKYLLSKLRLFSPAFDLKVCKAVPNGMFLHFLKWIARDSKFLHLANIWWQRPESEIPYWTLRCFRFLKIKGKYFIEKYKKINLYTYGNCKSVEL